VTEPSPPAESPLETILDQIGSTHPSVEDASGWQTFLDLSPYTKNLT